MHEAGSAILSFILSPFNWIVFLLIAGYFSKKKTIRKFCRFTALLIFLVFRNPFFLNEYARYWQPPPQPLNQLPVYSCGIILGGFISPDAREIGYFNIASDRFIQAVKLFKTGKINHILISGGNGKKHKVNFREAVWAKNEFIAVGIPDTAITIEDRSRNTVDNAMYGKQILDSLKLASPYLLITSAYHIPRASVIYKNTGLDVKGFACNYMNGRGNTSFGSLIPRLSVLYDWELYLKETAGYLYYRSKSKKK